MDWVNISALLPNEGEEVFIKIKGSVKLARFNKAKSQFTIHKRGKLPASYITAWKRIEHRDIVA